MLRDENDQIIEVSKADYDDRYSQGYFAGGLIAGLSATALAAIIWYLSYFIRLT